MSTAHTPPPENAALATFGRLVADGLLSYAEAHRALMHAERAKPGDVDVNTAKGRVAHQLNTAIEAIHTSPNTRNIAMAEAPDEVAALVGRLVKSASSDLKSDSALQERIAQLDKELREKPQAINDPEFKARLAHVVRDAEWITGTRFIADDRLRADLRDLATGHPEPIPTRTTHQKTTEPTQPTGGSQSTQNQPQQTTMNAQQVHFRPPGVLAGILNSLQRPAPATPPPWARPPETLGDRLGQYEARKAEQNTEELIQTVQQSANNAMRTLEAFGNGPGSGILKKIEQYAAQDPNGVAGVLSEMRPGGRYAQLRAEFNSAMTQERAFVAAYDKAVGTVSQYGIARNAVTAEFARRGLDPAKLDGQFREMDREIGEASAKMPGRKAGQSLQDEMAQKATEFFRQLMEKLRTTFAPGPPRPSQTPAAAPAMTP
jgi:hypothetical protein